MQTPSYHNRLQATYLRLKQKIRIAIRDGRFYRYTIKKQRQLLQRLTRYYQQLRRRGQWMVSAAVVGLVWAMPKLSYGQSFISPPSPNPFGLDKVSAHSAPSFVDIDGDGDLDAFVGEKDGNTFYSENVGSPTIPNLPSATPNPFGLSDVGAYSVPSFADIDGDGDLDAFVGEYAGNIFYFKNTGSNTAPSFTTVTMNPFGLSYVGNRSAPSFADIDGDGDLDAFVGQVLGDIVYFQNTGNFTQPAFVTPVNNPFGLGFVEYRSKPSFVDLDRDGDLDTFVGERPGSIVYFQNTGSSMLPAFATPITNPLGLSSVFFNATPSFVDIDGDNFLEAIIGSSDGNLYYFESDIPVPVELVYFKASLRDKTMQLSWQTASEINNQGFEVEQSSNAKAWKTIGFVAGNGTTLETQNYSFLDKQPIVGLNYYRLKQMDFDSVYEYSDIVAVNYESSVMKNEFLTYPNPVSQTLTYQIADTEVLQSVQLLDVYGNPIKTASQLNGQLSLEGVSAGMYVLVVETNTGKYSTEVVVE